MILLLLSLLATAADLRVVRAGDTIESIATQLGGPATANTLRDLNGLGPTAQPTPGDILQLPPQQGGVDQPAQVLSLVGTGVVRRGTGAAIPMLSGALLPGGAEICTDADSYATIRLAAAPGCTEEDDISMLPNTCMTVDGTHGRNASRSSVVSLTQGSVSIKATKTGQGAVAVVSPAGVATGANGGFRVTIEEGATRTEAVASPIAVVAQGAELDVPAGYGTRTNNGEAPGDLVQLLPPGSPTLPNAGSRLRIPDFAWTTVDRALGYRVEFAHDDAFSRLVRRSEVSTTTWRPAQLFLPYGSGPLHWRVVSFDRLGFEGIPSEGRELKFPRGVE